MHEASVHTLVDAQNELGESPLWDERERALWWVDSANPAIWRYDPGTGLIRRHPMPEEVGCIVLREQGGLCAAIGTGFALVDFEPFRLQGIASPEAGMPFNRLNDGCCDRAGRFWCGSMNTRGRDVPRESSASLYRLDPDHSWHRMDEGFTISNGLAFSPDDRTMYFSDTPSRNVYAYDYDLSAGSISNRRIFIRARDSSALVDGAAVDTEGGYWCAHIFGGAVARYTPDGRLDRRIELPTRDITCVAWGGDDLDVLYATSARAFLDAAALDRQPHAGAVWEIRNLGHRGHAQFRYAG